MPTAYCIKSACPENACAYVGCPDSCTQDPSLLSGNASFGHHVYMCLGATASEELLVVRRLGYTRHWCQITKQGKLQLSCKCRRPSACTSRSQLSLMHCDLQPKAHSDSAEDGRISWSSLWACSLGILGIQIEGGHHAGAEKRMPVMRSCCSQDGPAVRHPDEREQCRPGWRAAQSVARACHEAMTL